MLRPLLFILLANHTVQAEPLRVISWNIESGGADPSIIAKELVNMPKSEAYLLQEVSPRDIGRLAAAVRKAHGTSYKYYQSSLGGTDRLVILIDESKFLIRSFSELFSYEKYKFNDWRHRSPLVAHLECKSDGQEFLLVTVHLARGNAKLRIEQATGLREWAKSQALPVLLAGDCNFDYNFVTQRGNTSHRAFFQNGIWQEAVSTERIDSNWSDRNGDGRDDYPDSCLDFAAVCSNGFKVTSRSKVIVREGDFPDDDTTSDHRPLLMQVEFSENR